MREETAINKIKKDIIINFQNYILALGLKEEVLTDPGQRCAAVAVFLEDLPKILLEEAPKLLHDGEN